MLNWAEIGGVFAACQFDTHRHCKIVQHLAFVYGYLASTVTKDKQKNVIEDTFSMNRTKLLFRKHYHFSLSANMISYNSLAFTNYWTVV